MGIVVYVAGQLLQKTFIEPYYELSLSIAKIALNLVYYANIYSNPESASSEDTLEVRRIFRELAARLISEAHVLVGYSLLARFAQWPKKTEIQKAAMKLIEISNAVAKTGDPFANENRRNEIVRLLHIKPLQWLDYGAQK